MTYFEKVVVGLAGKLTRGDNIVVKAPELLHRVKRNDFADIIHPAPCVSARCISMRNFIN